MKFFRSKYTVNMRGGVLNQTVLLTGDGAGGEENLDETVVGQTVKKVMDNVKETVVEMVETVVQNVVGEERGVDRSGLADKIHSDLLR